MSILKTSILLALTLSCSGCAPQPTEPSAEPLIEQGKAAYVAGRYNDAREFFAQARELAPDEQDAFHGHARALHAQHLYPEAFEAYEEALSKNPDGVDVRAHYANALIYGGVFKGDQRWLRKGLDMARSLLIESPASTRVYQDLSTAIESLKEQPGYVETLEALEADHPDSPVVAIELHAARIRQAMLVRDEEKVEKLREDLRASLERQETESTDDIETRYQQAVGYGLLGEEGKTEDALRRLEQKEAGRAMAQQVRFTYPYPAARMAAYQSDDPTALILLLQKWEGRFPSTWEGGRRFANVFDKDNFRALRDWLRNPPEGVAESPPIADSLGTFIDIGTRLARFNDSNRMNFYAALCAMLIELRERPELVVELTDEAIAALEADETGMFYPGSPEAEVEKTRVHFHSILIRLRGQAFAVLGDPARAESELRTAAEMKTLTSHHTTFGRFLLDQDRAFEAADQFLMALAEGFTGGEVPGEDEVRQILVDLQASHGLPEGDLDKEVGRLKQARDREKKAELLANRVDQPAPAFTLTDTRGQTWSLEQQQGKVVLLNFWATWCGPCLSEMPHYKRLVDEYASQDDVVFLAVSTDELMETASDWLDEEDYSFTVVHDSGTMLDYNITGIPATVLIDRQSRIQFRDKGFSTPEQFFETLRARIEALRES